MVIDLSERIGKNKPPREFSSAWTEPVVPGAVAGESGIKTYPKSLGIGSFPKSWGAPPKSSSGDGTFPNKNPSILRGTPMAMETPNRCFAYSNCGVPFPGTPKLEIVNC